jgi:hypothetical protein
MESRFIGTGRYGHTKHAACTLLDTLRNGEFYREVGDSVFPFMRCHKDADYSLC